ncbi:MAG: pentapeptide repeat-containing protein [Acidimicrobiia bacterium]
MPPRDESPTPPRLPAAWGEPPPGLDDESSWDGLEVTGSFAGQAVSHVDVVRCHLRGAVFTGTEIDRLRLADTLVEDCELSGAILTHLAAVRVEFRRCRLSGVALPDADLTDVRFTDCKLDGANFRMTTWKRSRFDRCLLTAADFGMGKLAGVRLHGCDLTGADFSKTDLTGASLHGSTLDGVRGGEAFRGVVIGGDQVIPLALSVFSALGIVLDDDPDR